MNLSQNPSKKWIPIDEYVRSFQDILDLKIKDNESFFHESQTPSGGFVFSTKEANERKLEAENNVASLEKAYLSIRHGCLAMRNHKSTSDDDYIELNIRSFKNEDLEKICFSQNKDGFVKYKENYVIFYFADKNTTSDNVSESPANLLMQDLKKKNMTRTKLKSIVMNSERKKIIEDLRKLGITYEVYKFADEEIFFQALSPIINEKIKFKRGPKGKNGTF